MQIQQRPCHGRPRRQLRAIQVLGHGVFACIEQRPSGCRVGPVLLQVSPIQAFHNLQFSRPGLAAQGLAVSKVNPAVAKVKAEGSRTINKARKRMESPAGKTLLRQSPGPETNRVNDVKGKGSNDPSRTMRNRDSAGMRRRTLGVLGRTSLGAPRIRAKRAAPRRRSRIIPCPKCLNSSAGWEPFLSG